MMNNQSDINLTERVKIEYEQYLAPTYAPKLLLVRGEGRYVWDGCGKKYLDFAGGLAVNSLGHAHPRILKAMQEQAGKLMHVSNLYYNEQQGALAKELVTLTGPGKMFFCNSGAEANEALFKFARKWGSTKGKFQIITATQSFHGRTLGCIAATGQDKVKTGFDPAMPGFLHVPYNDLKAIEAAIGDQTVAVHVEGIQGEGGIRPATAEYLLGLRKLTNEKEILLLMDSVQCGCFRTGKWQSFQKILEGVPGGEAFSPDAIAMAKSLGGGFPMGAAWFSLPYADVLQRGSHATTFGGAPLACAVARAILAEVQEKRLDQNIAHQGQTLIDGLQKSPKDKVKEVRGFGGLIGVETVEENLSVVARLQEAGLLTVPATGNVIRFLPPLNTEEAEVVEALEIWRENL